MADAAMVYVCDVCPERVLPSCFHTYEVTPAVELVHVKVMLSPSTGSLLSVLIVGVAGLSADVGTV